MTDHDRPLEERPRRRRALAVLWLVLFAVPGDLEADGSWWSTASADDVLERPPHVPTDEVLEENGAIVGEIFIDARNVFDTSADTEGSFVSRTANALHVTTKRSVIEGKILFDSGDPYSAAAIRETARYLRTQGLFYDVWIEPVDYRHNVVDVAIVTRDVWTIGLSAAFERSGGENTYAFEATDGNFLGRGELLALKWEDDPEREKFRFRYIDRALFGSRSELHLFASDNSDGHRRTLDLLRPFYSLDTRWGSGIRLVDDTRVARLYSLGEEIRLFDHDREVLRVWGGLSGGRRGRKTTRWTVGFTYEKDTFGRHPRDPLLRRPSRVHDRVVSYPWIGFEYVEDGFIETRDLEQLNRTEDFNLGTEARIALGWSSTSWGGTQDQLVASSSVGFGMNRRPGELLFVDLFAEGRFFGEDFRGRDRESVSAGLEIEYYRRDFGDHQLYVFARADALWNPDLEEQLLLGGDTGLRGYPRNIQAGEKRYLVTLEQRFYSDLHVFDLVYVGGAVFFDAGRAWYEDGPLAPHDLGLLTDVGVGLRLSSSRSSRGRMIHIDVAYPLHDDFREIQWLVTSRETF